MIAESKLLRNKEKKVNTKTLLLAFVVFFNSEILNGIGSNPLGIKGVQEVFYLFLICFSFLYILSKARPIQDVFIISLTFLLIMLSAVSSAIKFGQPIEYGIIENRKVLALLVYFPLIYVLRSERVSYSQLEKAVVNMAVVCAIISVCIYLGLIPTINSIEYKSNNLREIRFAIGQVFIATSIVLLLAPVGKSVHAFRLHKAFVLAFVLIFIIQSRQLILITMLGLLLVGGYRRFWVISGIIIIVSFLVVGDFLTIFNSSFELFSYTLSNEYINYSWRAQSISTIIGEFLNQPGFGFGGLYIGWQDGFHNVYGPYFFLADVGIFGSLYRYGLLTFPIYGLYIALQVGILMKIKDHSYRRLFTVLFIMVLIGSPVGAPLEFRGQLTGFILAASSYFAAIRRNSLKEYIND